MDTENMNAVNEEATMPGDDGDDWDSIDLSGLVDEDIPAGEGDGGEDGGADQPAETKAPEDKSAAEDAAQPGADAAEAKGAEDAGADERFTLKHLGETRDFSRDEVTTLAQKGLDYDRIRAERDSMRAEMPTMRDAMGLLGEIAADSKISVGELIETLRARRLIDREAAEGRTITETGAREQIRREKAARDRDGEAQEEQPAAKPAASAPAQPDVTEDIRRFAQTFPEVKATDIPKKVWDEYRAGKGDLVSLYTIQENAALRLKLAQMEQNENNRGRSAGSVKSAGNRTAKTTMQEVWDAYDD